MTEVLLFAQAREAAGTSKQVFDGATVAEVLAAAIEEFGPRFAAVCATASFVVDGVMVLRAEVASAAPGAELAILPPVSGVAE